MATPYDIDDPEAVNSFLAILRAAVAARTEPASQDLSPIDSPPTSTSTSSPPDQVSNHGEINSSSDPSTTSSGVNTPGSGIRAPPSTPAFTATAGNNGDHLEPIAEALDFGSPVESKSKDPTSVHATPAQSDLQDKDKVKEPVVVLKKTEEADQILDDAQFQAHLQAIVRIAEKSNKNLSYSKHAPRRGIPVIVRTSPPRETTTATSSNSTLLKTSDTLKGMPSTSYQDSVVAKFRDQNSGDKIDSSKMIKVQGGGGSDSGEVGESSKSVPITTLGDSAATSAGEENRENQTYFSTWGTAAPRAAAPARIRTVVLTNLPINADPTLVTNLIHGGAIEELKITKPPMTATVTARVTFTDADAADAYYTKYPNGVDFRFEGKKCTAFVDKGKDVDVISGMMAGYLESGASRVVRVAGADEDWGMRALKRMAEAKNRALEAIVDTSREETRTIVFRFTNITDCVRFKGELVRDDEWEDCDVHFAEDPCKKATGVRVEGN